MEDLSYKGYKGNIEYSKSDNCFCGKVLGLPKNILIMHEGNTASELYNDFKAGIDHYLGSCKAKVSINSIIRESIERRLEYEK